MNEHEVSRTLVKSQPELWAELSDAASLARHLDRFGEIRITRAEPEVEVSWEAERATGLVRLEPSGWGTRVILRARTSTGEAPPEPDAREIEPVTEPAAEAEPVTGPAAPVTPPSPIPTAAPEPPPLRMRSVRFGVITRLATLLRPRPVSLQPMFAPEPDVPPQPAEPPEPPVTRDPPAPPDPPAPEVDAALTAALESLGQAHHRPFSRA